MISPHVQLTFDCADPKGLATFWAQVMHYPPPDVEGTHAVLRALGHPEATLGAWYRVEDPSGAGPKLAFQRVPEPKRHKNRLHLDLKVSEETGRHAEVARITGLGGQIVREVADEAGGFVVMTDPEGNEFCIG